MDVIFINIDDDFPFKKEFHEAILDFLKTRKPVIAVDTVIMAIYLMYLHDDLKENIKSLAKQYNLTEYMMDVPQELVEYSHSLPNTLYTNHLYDIEEYFLAKNVGFHHLPQYEYKELHDHLFLYINNVFPQYSVIHF